MKTDRIWRALSVALALCLTLAMCLSLAACGGTEQETDSDQDRGGL